MCFKKLFKNKDLREWINNIVAIIALIFLIFGYFQVQELNVNMKEIKSELIKTNEIIANNASITKINNVESINGLNNNSIQFG